MLVLSRDKRDVVWWDGLTDSCAMVQTCTWAVWGKWQIWDVTLPFPNPMVWIMKIGLQTLFPLKRFGVRPNTTAGPRSGSTCPQHCQKYALFPGLKYALLWLGKSCHNGLLIKTRSWVLTYTKNYLVSWHNDKKIIIIKHTYVWNTIVSI